MKKDNDVITVYWAPTNYMPMISSWSILFRDPEPVINMHKMNKDKKRGDNIFSCPSYVSMMKNVFVVKNNINDEIDFPDWYHTDTPDSYPKIYPAVKSIVSIQKQRPSSFENYSDVGYNMGWAFWASEPVQVKFTAPYFPPESPGVGVILSPGEFDIGQWYRPFVLDYHVPYDCFKLNFTEDQQLFYMHFQTDKKIQFKRYIMSHELFHISAENNASTNRLGSTTLIHRYQRAKLAKQNEQITYLINKSLVK